MPASSIKQKQIINAAIRLLGEQGVGVATAKIANLAGTSNGTLFNYFATKQILLDAVYLNIKKQVAKQLMGDISPESTDIKALFSHIWERYIEWAIANPLKQQVANLLKSSLIISHQTTTEIDETFRFITVKLEYAQAEKRIKVMPTGLLCEIAIAQMLATIHHANQHGLDQQQLKQLIRQSFDIYWDGIKTK